MRALDIRDLLFDYRWVTCPLPRGGAFMKQVRIGMPKVPPQVLTCVVYLFETEEDAEEGKDPAGTGFLAVHFGPGRFGHFYAVTCWHVAVDDSDPENPPAPVVRVNGADGEPIIVPLTTKDWYCTPGGNDVAVAPLQMGNTWKAFALPTQMFLTEEWVREAGINVGDDVFMMGLFADHDGGKRNLPAARFGNISVMPTKDALVEQQNIGADDAFIMDMHSRTGFSGSPVFVYRTFGSDLTVAPSRRLRIDYDKRQREPVELIVHHDTLFGFIGLHYAQFPEDWEIGTKVFKEARKRLKRDADRIQGYSGMTCVIPAWKILDLLNRDDLVALRREEEKEFEAMQKKNKPKPEKVTGSARPESGGDGEPDDHRTRFKRLLSEAVKRPKSSG